MLSRWGAGSALPSAIAGEIGPCTMPWQHSKDGPGYGGRGEPAPRCEHESFGLATPLPRDGTDAVNALLPSYLLAS